MMHPSSYSTVPFNGVHFMEVDPGTVVTDERSGESVTVDDDTVAFKGRVCFCTKKIFEALKAALPTEGNA